MSHQVRVIKHDNASNAHPPSKRICTSSIRTGTRPRTINIDAIHTSQPYSIFNSLVCYGLFVSKRKFNPLNDGLIQHLTEGLTLSFIWGPVARRLHRLILDSSGYKSPKHNCTTKIHMLIIADILKNIGTISTLLRLAYIIGKLHYRVVPKTKCTKCCGKPFRLLMESDSLVQWRGYMDEHCEKFKPIIENERHRQPMKILFECA